MSMHVSRIRRLSLVSIYPCLSLPDHVHCHLDGLLRFAQFRSQNRSNPKPFDRWTTTTSDIVLSGRMPNVYTIRGPLQVALE